MIEFISILPIILARYVFPRLLGYLIIAERYIPDFLVWVSTTTNDTEYLKCLEARFLLALSSKAEVKIHVTASKGELLRRKGNELNEKFLDKQLILYEKMARLLNAYEINTTGKSISETLRKAMTIIAETMCHY